MVAHRAEEDLAHIGDEDQDVPVGRAAEGTHGGRRGVGGDQLRRAHKLARDRADEGVADRLGVQGRDDRREWEAAEMIIRSWRWPGSAEQCLFIAISAKRLASTIIIEGSAQSGIGAATISPLLTLAVDRLLEPLEVGLLQLFGLGQLLDLAG